MTFTGLCAVISQKIYSKTVFFSFLKQASESKGPESEMHRTKIRSCANLHLLAHRLMSVNFKSQLTPGLNSLCEETNENHVRSLKERVFRSQQIGCPKLYFILSYRLAETIEVSGSKTASHLWISRRNL